MSRFSFKRMTAVFIKEFQQMLRDRLTFGMAVGVPILQLVLFGYAINTDPRGLPTALVAADASPIVNSIAANLQNTGYFRIVHQGKSEEEAERLLDEIGITVNKNGIPFDPLPPNTASGIRLGTPATTSRGFGEAEMRDVGRIIIEAITARDDDAVQRRLAAEVAGIVARFPVPGLSAA